MSATLWLDCDVAVLRSPFVALKGVAPSDLAHQRNSVAGDVNTGVMLVRSEPLVRHIISASRWWEVRHRDLEQVVELTWEFAEDPPAVAEDDVESTAVPSDSETAASESGTVHSC